MEKKETNTLSIFQRPVWVSLFALTAAISWGWAYPLIKMGMEEYQITADMTGSKMLFAGIRFFTGEVEIDDGASLALTFGGGVHAVDKIEYIQLPLLVHRCSDVAPVEEVHDILRGETPLTADLLAGQQSIAQIVADAAVGKRSHFGDIGDGKEFFQFVHEAGSLQMKKI